VFRFVKVKAITARGGRLVAPVLAWVLFALVLALAAVSLPLGAAARQLTATDVLNDVMLGLLTAVLAGVGLVVAWHLPRNPMGWLLLGSGVFFMFDATASPLEVVDYRLHEHLPLGPVAVILQPSWAPAIALFGLAFLLFPDGKPASPGWRWLVRCYAAVSALWIGGAFAITITAVISHHIQVTSGGDLVIIDHPSGAAALWGVVQDLFFTVLSLSLVARVIQMAVSYRRSVGERRQQLKWVAGGAAVSAVGGALSLALSGTSGVLGIVGEVGVAALAALPVSMGVAILRFRLYEIDRIISRTLSYAIVSGLLIGVYVGLVLLATGVFTIKSPVAVAAATLAAAALFSPVRWRVQRVVDRRFNRASYDADRTVQAFAARLKDAVDLDSVRGDLAGVVYQALEPAHVSLWLSDRG
jgi:hypothetical protein